FGQGHRALLKAGIQGPQELGIDPTLAGSRGQGHSKYRDRLQSMGWMNDRRVIAPELLDEHRLAHAAVSKNGEPWWSGRRRVVAQGLHQFEDAPGSREAHPAFRSDGSDADIL